MTKYRFKKPEQWLLLLAVAMAMLVWNWKLSCATSTGVLLMLLVYRMQAWNWEARWQEFRQLLNGSNRQLTLAVGSGGIAALGTYMAISVCLESDSPWLAAGDILQGLGIFAILGLLIWQACDRKASHEGTELDQMLMDLTHADPLRRLIAVRRLAKYGGGQIQNDRPLRGRNAIPRRLEGDRQSYQTIIDAWRLMLATEREPIVRNAILDGLKIFSPNLPKAAPKTRPVSIPLDLKHSTTKTPHEIH